jgi:hypothetical protein
VHPLIDLLATPHCRLNDLKILVIGSGFVLGELFKFAGGLEEAK